jgi:hypothetical protein
VSTGQQPTEEELRAAYEAEIKRLRVEQILLETIVSLVNLGMRRTGVAPGTESEREPEQVQLAVESVRALLPVVERTLPEQAKPIRDALSQLQLAYVRIGGGAPTAAESAPADSGPAQPASGPGPGPAPGAGEPGVAPEGPPESEPAAPPRPSEPDGTTPGEPGPAQRSGRLWVPGQ